MPEERNRIEVDGSRATCSLPGRALGRNAPRGGRRRGEIHVVGDVMADASRGSLRSRASAPDPRPAGSPAGSLRACDGPSRGERLGPTGSDASWRGSAELRRARRLPAHPRTAGARGAGMRSPRRVRVIEPLGYLDFAALASQAHVNRDRLRRAPEGGVLVRRPVRDDAAVDGVGRHRRGRRNVLVDDDPARIAEPRPRNARCPPDAPSALRRRPRLRSGSRPSHGGTMALCSLSHREAALIAIVGAGYVGVPLAQVFAEAGRPVLPRRHRRGPRRACSTAARATSKHVPASRSASSSMQGLLSATADYDSCFSGPDALLICVPTPLSPHLEPDLSYVVLDDRTDHAASAPRPDRHSRGRPRTLART